MGSILFANKIGPQNRTLEEKMSQAIDFINQFYASVKRYITVFKFCYFLNW